MSGHGSSSRPMLRGAPWGERREWLADLGLVAVWEMAVCSEFLRSLGVRGPSQGLSGVMLPSVIR